MAADPISGAKSKAHNSHKITPVRSTLTSGSVWQVYVAIGLTPPHVVVNPDYAVYREDKSISLAEKNANLRRKEAGAEFVNRLEVTRNSDAGCDLMCRRLRETGRAS
jgi:hypothetical protein